MNQDSPLTHNKPSFSPAQIEKNDSDIATGNIDMAELAGITGLVGTPNHLEIPTGGLTFEEESAPIGTVTFRPIDGKFFGGNHIVDKMEPYCKIKLGWHSGKLGYIKGQGLRSDCYAAIVLDRKHDEHFAKLKIKDKKRTVLNDTVGVATIDLDEVEAERKVSKWYPLKKGGTTVGEVLLDIEYKNKNE